MATNVSPPKYGNVVIGGSSAAGSNPITITGAGSNYTSSQVLTVNGTGSANWAASNTAKMTAKGQLQLEGDNADILVQGKSMKAWMETVEKRLSILQPKPELHEKYTALEQAYEHYKTLEALLYDDQKSNQ